MVDHSHMRAALALARRGLGNAWPNPSVGCVVVRDGHVVGRAVTAPGGRPHAEPRALAMAGAAARGGTAYVTLEPCCHWGRTPPCTDILIEAGVARVVIACRDPDPRVNGAGVERLRAAGIEVVENVLADAGAEIVAGFAQVIRSGRPLVTLKLASTLDGRIATHSGESRWITSEAARRRAHSLRATHDAVMVGVGTVLTDDPELTCRIPGMRPNALVRVIADSHLRTPLTGRIAASAASVPTWFLVRHGADPERRRAYGDLGAELIEIAGAGAGIDLTLGLRALAERGITRLLIEGGAQLAAALLRADLVDRVVWFHAPAVMGGNGWPAVQGFGVELLSDMRRFLRHSVSDAGADIMSEYARAA